MIDLDDLGEWHTIAQRTARECSELQRWIGNAMRLTAETQVSQAGSADTGGAESRPGQPATPATRTHDELGNQLTDKMPAGATAPATAAELVAAWHKLRNHGWEDAQLCRAGDALAAALERSEREMTYLREQVCEWSNRSYRAEERITELERERDETADKARELIDSLYASLDRIRREVGRE